MPVDDTPHRIYISDLSAELAAIESDEDTPVFLPDIEKHLAKIPRHILRARRDAEEEGRHEDNQVVLYNVPSSLSVAPERDSVRKAIVEARRRIREGMGGGVGEVEGEGITRGGNGNGSARENVGVHEHEEQDEDAMDLD